MKTDKVDTHIIAKTLMLQDFYRLFTLVNIDIIELKQLGHSRQKTLKQCTRLKIQLVSYVDQSFHELQYFFKSDLHQKSVDALLKVVLVAKVVVCIHLTHLANLLNKASHGRLKKDIAKEVRVLSQKSIGHLGSALAIQITHSVNQIELLDSKLAKIEAEMTKIMRFHDPVILTIPGMSYINGGMILGRLMIFTVSLALQNCLHLLVRILPFTSLVILKHVIPECQREVPKYFDIHL